MFGGYACGVLSPWLLPALLAAAAPPVDARPSTTGISLAEAREHALRAGPDVVLAELRAEVARTEIDVAGTLANPTLGLSTARLTAKLTTLLGVPLPLFGQRGTAVSAAKADALAARLDVEAVRLDARWNATRAWLDLWEAQERARLLTEAAADIERVANVARERFAAGTAPRVDVVRTSADQARARAEASAAAGVVPAFAARLAVWVSSNEPSSLRAAGPVELGPLPSENDAMGQLFARHPTLRRDRAQADAAAAHVRAEQRLRWPIVNADVTVAQGDPEVPGTDVTVGVSFEAPVLNQRRGPIARARAQRALAEITTETELRRLGAELTAAYRECESAGARARSLAEEVLPALEEARRMTEEGYRDGRVDLLRVLDANAAARDARLAAASARAAWQRARADVERAVGLSPTERSGDEP
jgi:cobalt-zinc-cadmium efflux system outer membrane protein